jgi:hypothetical protein
MVAIFLGSILGHTTRSLVRMGSSRSMANNVLDASESAGANFFNSRGTRLAVQLITGSTLSQFSIDLDAVANSCGLTMRSGSHRVN